MRAHVGTGLAALALGASAFVAPVVTPTTVAPPPVVSVIAPQQAEAALNDLVIKNSSSSVRSLQVCKHWIGYDGQTCDYAQGTAYLSPGQNSKSVTGWADVDAYYVNYGYKVKFGQHAYVTTSGWHKISGCGGCTQTATVSKL